MESTYKSKFLISQVREGIDVSCGWVHRERDSSIYTYEVKIKNKEIERS